MIMLVTHFAPLVRIYSNENDLGVVDIRATIYAGLSEAEVVAARQAHGQNVLSKKKKKGFMDKLKVSVAKDADGTKMRDYLKRCLNFSTSLIISFIAIYKFVNLHYNYIYIQKYVIESC